MSGCERHDAAPDPHCAACALEAELRAVPMVEPPADLAANVIAAIAGEDAALEARLRSMPEVEPPAELTGRIEEAVAADSGADKFETVLRSMPMVEPPAGLLAAVDEAVAFEPIAEAMRSAPMIEPPIDIAGAVLDELAYEDRLQRSAVWRAAGISLSAAAAGMLLLTDPAGLSSAAASFFNRATAYVPDADQLGPVAELGDFTPSTEPGLADHVVTAFDSAQLALANGMAAPEAAGGWLATGGLWWMVLGVVGLVAVNGVIAKALMRRA